MDRPGKIRGLGGIYRLKTVNHHEFVTQAVFLDWFRGSTEIGRLADQFFDRSTLVDDRGGSPVEILDECRVGFDTQVVVDGRQEVTCRAGSFDGIFAPFVGRADDLPGANSAPGPDV